MVRSRQVVRSDQRHFPDSSRLAVSEQRQPQFHYPGNNTREIPIGFCSCRQHQVRQRQPQQLPLHSRRHRLLRLLTHRQPPQQLHSRRHRRQQLLTHRQPPQQLHSHRHLHRPRLLTHRQPPQQLHLRRHRPRRPLHTDSHRNGYSDGDGNRHPDCYTNTYTNSYEQHLRRQSRLHGNAYSNIDTYGPSATPRPSPTPRPIASPRPVRLLRPAVGTFRGNQRRKCFRYAQRLSQNSAWVYDDGLFPVGHDNRLYGHTTPVQSDPDWRCRGLSLPTSAAVECQQRRITSELSPPTVAAPALAPTGPLPPLARLR